jgi:class 3 adenylate cyclase
LTYGYALVVLYGKNLEKAHIDIIGSSISMASKIVSIAKTNQVLLGESIYNILRSSEFKSNLIEINLDPTKWKYLSRSDPESMYRVYEYIEN